MSLNGLKTLIRCPAPRRALLFGLLVGTLAACSYFPRDVAGVPAGAPWFALPLRSWLAEDRALPEAMAICRPPDCGPAMVVTVVRMKGEDADRAEAVLRRPDSLAHALQDMKGRKSKVRTAATVRPLRNGPLQGFVLAIGRADGERRPAYGAALGRRTGASLRVVLVIGEAEAAVEEAARRAAEENLGEDRPA